MQIDMKTAIILGVLAFVITLMLMEIHSMSVCQEVYEMLQQNQSMDVVCRSCKILTDSGLVR